MPGNRTLWVLEWWLASWSSYFFLSQDRPRQIISETFNEPTRTYNDKFFSQISLLRIVGNVLTLIISRRNKMVFLLFHTFNLPFNNSRLTIDFLITSFGSPFFFLFCLFISYFFTFLHFYILLKWFFFFRSFINITI